MDPNLDSKPSNKNVDETLRIYQQAHQSTARYSIHYSDYLSKAEPVKVASNLDYVKAKNELNRLNAEKSGHTLELENPEESKLAVLTASANYWGDL